MRMPAWITALFFFLNVLVAAQDRSIWIEGESPAQKSIQKNGWYDSVKRADLSGEGWLGHFGNSKGTATYQFHSPKSGDFKLWLRANPNGTKMRFRINTGRWQDVNFSQKSHTRNVASDRKPDLRFVAWIPGGNQSLKSGANRLDIEFHSNNHFHGALDCLCFTTDQSYIPEETRRPGEKKPFWPVPEITESNFDEWMEFVEPSREELGWRTMRWHRSLSEAAREARDLNRPLLLWAMNGHPCGET